jgi:hypothetical protein
MTKTKTQKALAFIGVIATLAFGAQAQAAVIGTGTVTGSPALNSSVTWNDVIPGTATGIINGITINARVLPILNMVISSGSIELGTLNNSTYVTGSVDIELGTNAKNGASVTAKSSSGGLYSAAATSTINNLTADGVAESYLFSSTLSGGTDSSIAGFTQTPLNATEVNNNTTNHTIYSSNKAQASSGSADVSFNVSAKIDAQTPAGLDYKDVVVITVVGNF